MKISIITVSYNSAATIYDTLQSIRSQGYPDIEHIVIDGGSTDDTLRILQDFPHIAKIISEKDNGLYYAMNKGVELATGDVIGILNSDDVYAQDDVLAQVAEYFKDKTISATYGDLQYVKSNDLNKVVRTWKAGNYATADFYYGWMPPHPTFL